MRVGENNFDQENQKFQSPTKVEESEPKVYQFTKIDPKTVGVNCCQNMCGVMVKRCRENRSNYKVTVCEVFIPIVFMLLGCFFSSFDQTFQSTTKTLSIEEYPMKQKVLFNENIIDRNNSDTTP